MNRSLINDKYRGLVPYNKEKFVASVNKVKKSIRLDDLDSRPALIYISNIQRALQYTLCVYYSLKRERLMDYYTVTAQEVAENHFDDSDKRDHEISNSIAYADILFIKIAITDRMNQYMEALITDIVERRDDKKKLTYVIYDTMGIPSVSNTGIQRIHQYFYSREFPILEIGTDNPAFSAPPTRNAIKGTVSDDDEDLSDYEKGVRTIKKGGNK